MSGSDTKLLLTPVSAVPRPRPRLFLAIVTNTPWGERGLFVFDPKSDLIAKPLHVSPFMDMLGNWSIKANAPGDNLFVAISVQHPTLGDYFTATLRAKKVSSSSVSDHSLFFWLMPHKVAVWIYWHVSTTSISKFNVFIFAALKINCSIDKKSS
ncbi:hypothetical protein L484_021644 [Morus notabilis]|uniref:Uncharacterized protein n=1 Tax=Morus notabilis TaxID=981085 RepID=W9S6K9_9ROSA|nr:hypothetical protein L484_021644 [Morus notabilis]